ncbi:MAG: amidase [Bacteroidetes bacterium HGW-Bacteroidetes-15]|nr:MAG: amidase [Bacteroidetes bacterium HGW-Bacteroidetes-15]
MKTRPSTILLIIILITSLSLNLFQLFDKNTLDTKIKSAESLFALSFTGSERDSLKDGVKEAIGKYEDIHNFDLSNDVAPSLIFSPVPLSYSPKNIDPISNFAIPRDVSVPQNLDELAFYTLSELASLIKGRKISSYDLTKMCVERLKKYDPTLHCVITLLEDRALAHAKLMDDELEKGKYRGPLHGIPFGVKDLLALEGYPFTWGSAIYKDQIATITSPVVEKLEDAGAVLVAKLSLGELAWGDVWYGEMTRNPWNTETGSSGSSAGSASATAAGLVPFAIGSETWGSIVSPSTVCGVTGLRPTFGRVSRTGAMALSWTMDKIGPICRTAQDCAIVLHAINGLDGIDPTLVDIPFNVDMGKDIRKLKVGYVKGYFEEDYSMKANDEIALKTLNELGVELVPVNLPENLPISALSIILDAEAAAAFSELTLTNKDDLMVRQGVWAWPNFFRKARFIPAVEYIQANRIRTRLIYEFAKIFEEVDVIISPSFGGNQLLMTNLTGHPALSVPTGFTEEGLPTSITFIGNWYKEDDIMLLGNAYQNKTEWFRQIPEGFVQE